MDTFALPDGAELLVTGDGVRAPGVPRRRAHLGRAVPLRDRPGRARARGSRRSRRRDDLSVTWGKSAEAVRAEADRYLADPPRQRPRACSSGSRRLADPMSYRPLIAVVAYHLADDRVARWPDGGYGVPAPYLEALRRAGARTAILAPGEDGEPEELLEPFDGLRAGRRRRRRPLDLRRRARHRAPLRGRARPRRVRDRAGAAPPTGCTCPPSASAAACRS